MVDQTIEIICGDGFCQLGETLNSCPLDCMPDLLDYLRCFFTGKCNLIIGINDNILIIFWGMILLLILIYFKTRRK